MRNIMLATSGESPQVITETLYAIHKDPDQYAWPDEIRMITTNMGEKLAQEGLLNEGHLKRLCAEIGRPVPLFGKAQILIIPDTDGNPVDDSRTTKDHESMGNFIIATVREIANARELSKGKKGDILGDFSFRIHASLAGGRKTMTFFLGYAMGMFGRHFDTLTHVLVSTGFESNRGFWFPTVSEGHRYLESRQENMPKLDASLAEVTLASIPFICLRDTLPTLYTTTNNPMDFSSLVDLVNFGGRVSKEEEEAIISMPTDSETRLNWACDLELYIDSEGRSLILKNRAKNNKVICEEINMELPDFAFFCMMAKATINEFKNFYRPDKKLAKDHIDKIILRDYYFEELCALLGLESPNIDDEKKTDEIINMLSDVDGIKEKTLESLADGMTAAFFNERINHIKAELEKYLPKNLYEFLTPKMIWNQDETSCYTGTKKGSYGISLPPGRIIFY